MVTAAASAFRPTFVGLGLVGLIVLLPTFVTREVKRYWLVLLIISFLFEVGKRLTKGIASPWLLEAKYGMPSSGNLDISIYPSDLIMLLLVAHWFFRIATHKERFYFPKISYFFLAFLLWASISSMIKSVSLYLSFFDLVRQSLYFITYLYISNNLTSKSLLRGIVLGCMIALLLEGTIIIAMFKTQSDWYLLSVFTQKKGSKEDTEMNAMVWDVRSGDNIKRSRGTFDSSGHAAFYLELMIPLSLILLISSQTKKEKFIYLILTAMGIIALICTFSRAGYLGGLVAIFSSLFLGGFRNLISKTKFMAMILFVVIGFLASTPKLIDLMSSRPKSYTHRWALMEQGMKMIFYEPILGVGLNNAGASLVSGQWSGKEDIILDWEIDPLHNQFVIFGVETGLVGLFFYLCFFAGIVWNAFRNSKSGDPYIASISIALFGSLLGFAFHANIDPVGRHSLYSMLWVFAGVSMALNRIQR